MSAHESEFQDSGIPCGLEPALMALRPHQCKWPIGDIDDPGFHFCTRNRVVIDGEGERPYCAAHERGAWQRGTAWSRQSIERAADRMAPITGQSGRTDD